MSTTVASPLADRDTNMQMTSTAQSGAAAGLENKMQGEQPHHHKAMANLNVKRSGAYVSPSDAILSPASQKLQGFKQRQVNKQSANKNPTARALFSRTASSISSTTGLEDSEDISAK